MKAINIIEEGKLGGPQVRMARVAAALNDRAETLIAMPRANSEGFQALCDEVGASYRVMSINRITRELRAALAYVVFLPVEIFRLVRMMRREKADIVHASGGSWQFKAVVAAKLAGVPSVWHLNDTSMPGWVRRVFRLVQPLASGFIFASHRSRAYYGDLITGDRPEAIVPSTVDLTRFAPGVPPEAEAEVFAALGDAPVIGTVANVNPIKGLELLIRAGAVLQAERPALRIVVVGPIHSNQRAYADTLKALATDLGVTIDWVGGRGDVRPLLERFDVYVCSSLAESSPVSVWEAMAMARPVVSTDVGDVSRHVVEGESGHVVAVNDVEAMMDRIAGLLDDPEGRARMGAAAREAVGVFTPANIADKTLAIYERVCASVGQRGNGDG